jgi:hypothetical protein
MHVFWQCLRWFVYTNNPRMVQPSFNQMGANRRGKAWQGEEKGALKKRDGGTVAGGNLGHTGRDGCILVRCASDARGVSMHDGIFDG